MLTVSTRRSRLTPDACDHAGASPIRLAAPTPIGLGRDAQLISRRRTYARRARAALLALATLMSATGCRASPPTPAPADASPPPRADAARPNPKPAIFVDKGDLAAIRARGHLRVLVNGAGENALPRRGLPASVEIELARELAARHGLETQIRSPESHDALLPALVNGQADLIAAQLTVTESRSRQVAFTRPLYTVSEMVVGPRGDPSPPKSVEALAGREVHVRRSSAYFETLEALRRDTVPDLVVVPVDEHIDVETIAYEVGRGRRPLTVVDSHTLTAIQAYNNEIVPLFPIADGRRIAWAVRKDNPGLLAAANAFMVEHALARGQNERFTGDLAEIRRRGVLRVLSRNNPVTYYLRRGQQRGFDFELVEMLADALNVRLAMIVPPSRDALLPWLLEGRGDLIAASLTVTPERAQAVKFSRPYLYVQEMLVFKQGGPQARQCEDLRGQRIHVRPSSSYFGSLEALKQQGVDFEIVPVAEDLETEHLVEQVGRGEISFTVADSHILSAEATYDDSLDGVPIATLAGQPATDDNRKHIAFAVRPQSVALARAVDRFVEKNYRGLRYNMARKRYFSNPRHIHTAKVERAGRSGRLTPYDRLIRQYSARYGLDWRLMAAQAFVESRFKPKAKSDMGAIGLFQIMPRTGRGLGFKNLTDPEQSTHAGVKYMHRLVDRWPAHLPLQERLRFALAAYNAGPGHVLDARRLAAQIGRSPDIWFGHVEEAIVRLRKPRYYRKARYGYCRGTHTRAYVRAVHERYEAYVEIVER